MLADRAAAVMLMDRAEKTNSKSVPGYKQAIDAVSCEIEELQN
jgi:hypothetical protein